MFPLIFNLHLIHQKQKTECGSRTEVTHLDQDWCRISSCVFYRVSFIVCVCVCLCVCTRRWWGLFSLLSVILAVAKMGGMKRNIAYWPADEAVAVIAQTNRTWWLLQEDWEMGNRGTAWSPAADSCVCVCVCMCVPRPFFVRASGICLTLPYLWTTVSHSAVDGAGHRGLFALI